MALHVGLLTVHEERRVPELAFVRGSAILGGKHRALVAPREELPVRTRPLQVGHPPRHLQEGLCVLPVARAALAGPGLIPGLIDAVRVAQHDDVFELAQEEPGLLDELRQRWRRRARVVRRWLVQAPARVPTRLVHRVVTDRRRLRGVASENRVEAAQRAAASASLVFRLPGAEQDLPDVALAQHAELVEDREVPFLEHGLHTFERRVLPVQVPTEAYDEAPGAVRRRRPKLHLERCSAGRRRQNTRRLHEALLLLRGLPHEGRSLPLPLRPHKRAHRGRLA